MYLPKHFREDRPEVLHRAMRDIGAATIVSQGPDGLIATHVPIELDPSPAPFGMIRCHFARANPHAAIVADADELLLIFQGPQSYVTPSWYPSKQESGKVVPTWNYVAIHAYGAAETYTDPDRLRRHLGAMTGHHESGYALPWGIDDAPADFIDGMCRAIVGLQITLSRIEGKWKVSQNRPAADRAGVIDGLRSDGSARSLEMADLVEQAAGG